jgi:hypothetical protein
MTFLYQMKEGLIPFVIDETVVPGFSSPSPLQIRSRGLFILFGVRLTWRGFLGLILPPSLILTDFLIQILRIFFPFVFEKHILYPSLNEFSTPKAQIKES